MQSARFISTTNGLTNNGDLHTGRLHLTTTVSNGASCVGLNGYQASTTAGSIASCINGVWTTPNATTAVIPCTTQTVGGWNASSGSSGACFGTANAAASGSTVTVTASSGGSGSASYMCSGGLWIWQSGSCTPSPCPTQTVSWGGGCSGTISGAAAGASGTVSAINGVGTATATCSSTGSGAWSTPSGSCTVFSNCSGYATWCGGKLGNSYTLSHSTTVSVPASANNTYGGQDLGGTISGSVSLTCNNGSVIYNSRSCTYNANTPPKYYNPYDLGQNITYPSNDKASSYCSAVLAPGASVTSTSTGYLYESGSPNWNHWVCWSPSGLSCSTQGGTVTAPFCTPDGCSGWAWKQMTYGYANIIGSLRCDYSGA